MLSRALQKSGITPQDVIIVPVTLEEHESAYLSDQVDAVVTFDPQRSRLVDAGANVVFDSSEIPGEIVDVLLVRPELADQENSQIKTLIDGYFEALDYLQQEPGDAARRMAVREQLSPDEFLESLEGLKLTDRQENQRLLGDSTENLGPVIQNLQSLMVQNSVLKISNGPSVLLDDSFVQEATP